MGDRRCARPTKSVKYIFSNNDVSENHAIVGFTQRVVVISYRRFGATSRSHIRVFFWGGDSRTLKTGTIDCPETHYSLRNNPVECSSHLLRSGSLKSRSDVFVRL